MSRTVDERIVSMQFDNENFEQNVRTSMSTLEKLKQSLNLKGAAKGIDDLNAATKRVDMSGIARGVEQCSLKFNALYTISDQVLRNIVNKAQAAGEKLIKSLSVDNVSAGWDKYAQKTANVQTLVNSTGKSVAEINEYLNKLMWYSDETSYGFTDMTNALATMTSSGGNIDKLIPMIMGVANATAYAGKSSAEFSRLMQYSVNQAYSTGYMQVQDWKSIEGATVNSKQLIQSLISAGEELGKIEKGTINLSNFRGSLADKWLDKDVMEAGFGAFSQVTEEIYKGIESGIFENYADGLEKIGNKYGEVAARAAASAQEAKTFGEAMDATKDAAASSWMRIFEIIFGNYEEARVLWTKLANTLYDVFVAPVQNFADLLEEAFSSSPIGKIVGRIKELTGSIDKVSAKVKNVIKTAEDYEKIVDRIINNEFGNGQKRWDKLTEMGYDWAHAQNLVNERLGCSVRHATNYSEAQSEVAKSQEKVNEEQSKTIDNLAKLSDKELKQIGFTQNEIKELRELAKVADDAGYSLSQVVDNPDLLSGRNLFIGSFENIGNAILQFAGTIKKAFTDVFGTLKPTQLYKFIAAFRGLTTKMQLSKKTTDKLVRTFKGLFAVLKIVTTITGGTLKIAFKILTTVLGAFNLDILDATAYVGDLLVKFQQWLTENNFVIKGIQKLADALASGVKKIKAWFESFKESETVVAIVGALKTKLSELKDIGTWAIAGLKNGFQNGIKAIPEILTDLGKKIIDAIKKVLGIHSPSTVFFELAKNCIQGFVNGIKAFFGIVTNSMSEFGSVIVDGFKAIPWDKLIPVGISVGLIITATKIAAALNTFAKTVSNVSNTVNDITNIFNSLTKSLKAKLKADVFKSIAASIAMIAGAIFVLAQINDQGKLWSAVGAVAVITLILVGLSYAINKMDKLDGFDFAKLSFIILSFASAILLIAFATKIVGELAPNQAFQGFLSIVAVVTAMAAVFWAFGKFVDSEQGSNIDKAGFMIAKMSIALLLMVGVAKLSESLGLDSLKGLAIATAAVGMVIAICWAFGKFVKGKSAQNIDKAGDMIFKVSLALLLMVGVFKLAGSLTDTDIENGISCIAVFTIFVAALLAITKIDKGKQLAKIGGTLLAISFSMMMLIGVCKLVGMLSEDDIANGIAFMIVFTIFIAALVSVTKCGSNEQMGKVAATILAAGVAIALMAASMILISLLSWEGLAKGVAAVAIFGLIIKGMISATKGANEVKGSIIAMSVAIAILAASIALLSLLDPASLIAPTLAMSALMGMFSIMIKACKNANNAIGQLIAMTVAIGIMAGAILLLSKIPVESAIGSAVALSVLLLALSTAMVILKYGASSIGESVKGILALTLMAVPLLALVGVLTLMNGVQNAIKNVTALSILATALSLLLIPLSLVGIIIGASGGLAALGIAALLAMAVPLLAFVGVLAAMQGIDVAKGNVSALISLATAMTLLLIPLTVVGVLFPAALGGIISLTAMAIPMLVFIEVIKKMNGIENATANTMLLLVLMSALTDMLAKLSAIAILAMVGVGALYALINIIAVMGVVCTAIGGLITLFPSLETFLDKGIGLLVKIAGGLGTVIGAFVDGILTAATENLPEIGSRLSQFMLNLTPFIVGAKMINEETVSGIKSLAETILILTGANLLEGITSFLTGESSIEEFGTQLGYLGTGLANFRDQIGVFTEEQVATVDCAAKAIKLLAEASATIPNSGGWVGAIVGENDLDTFADQFPILGTGLKNFLANIGTFSEEQISTVDCAAKAVETLAEAASEIPNSGGWAGAIVGENDLGTFAEQFPKLGTGLKGFLTNVGTFTDDQIGTVNCACKAITALAGAASEIPNSGGWVGAIVGENDLGTFADQFPKVGTGLSGFAKNLGTFTDAQIATVNAGIKALRAIANIGALKTNGIENISFVSNKLPSLAKKIAEFSNKLSEVSADSITTAVSKVNKISEMIKNLKVDSDSASNFKKALKDLGNSGLKKFVEEFTGSEALSKLSKAGKQMVDKLVDGAESKQSSMEKKLKSLAQKGADAAKEKKDAFKSAGKDLGKGLIEGIESKEQAAYDAGYALGQKAVQGEKDGQQSKSPSKLTIKAGKWLGEGLVIGIQNMGRAVYKASYGMGETAVNTISGAVARVSDFINSDIDSQPTIRPVLDLSDIKSGVNTISGLFSGETLAYNTSIAGSIASSMSSKIQNGGNNDVISAIEDLGRKLSKSSGNTYSINGITYDDGSNVSNAVRDLIRAVAIERRV